MALFGFLGHILELLVRRLLLFLEINMPPFVRICMYPSSEQFLKLYQKHHPTFFQQCMRILKHVYCRLLSYRSSSICKKEKCKSASRPLKTDIKVRVLNFYERWKNPVVYFFSKCSIIDDGGVDESEDESEDEENNPYEVSIQDENEESVKKTVEHSESVKTSKDPFKMKTDATEELSDSSVSQTPQKRKADSEKSERVKRSKSKEMHSETVNLVNAPAQLEVGIRDYKMSFQAQSKSRNLAKTQPSSASHINQGYGSTNKKYHHTGINQPPKNTVEPSFDRPCCSKDSTIKSKSVSSSSVEDLYNQPCNSEQSIMRSIEEIENAWKYHPGLDLNPVDVKKDATHQKSFYKEKKYIRLPPEMGKIIRWAVKCAGRSDSKTLKRKVPLSDEEKLPLEKYREIARELAESFLEAYNKFKEKEKRMRDKKESKNQKQRPKCENMDYVEGSFKEESPSDSSNDDSSPASQDSPTNTVDSPVPPAETPSEYDLTLFEVSPCKQVAKIAPSSRFQSENLCPVLPRIQNFKDVLRLPGVEYKSNPVQQVSSSADRSNMFTLQTILVAFSSEEEIVRKNSPAIHCRDVFYIPSYDEKGNVRNQSLSSLFRILRAQPESDLDLCVEEFLKKLHATRQVYYEVMYEGVSNMFQRFRSELRVPLVPLRQLIHHDDDYELKGDSLVPGSSFSNVVHISPSFKSDLQLVVLDKVSPEKVQGMFPTIVDQQAKSGKMLCKPVSFEVDKQRSHQRKMDAPSTSKLDSVNFNIYGLDSTEIRVPKENVNKTLVNPSCQSNVLTSARKTNVQKESQNKLPDTHEANLPTSAKTSPAQTSANNQCRLQKQSTCVSHGFEVLFGFPSPELLGFPSPEKNISNNKQRASSDLRQFTKVVDVTNKDGSENINKELCPISVEMETNSECTLQLSTSQSNTIPREDMLSPCNILELSPDSDATIIDDDADTSLKELAEDESKNI